MPEAESNIKPPETTTEQDAFHDSSPNFEDYEMSPYEGEVVISGISCRLPESENIQEFRDNLMNGVDMITEDDRRWKPGLYGLPPRHGKLKDLTKFDADYFGVHPKQAHYLDPQVRNLLELTYEAIVDSGTDPESIKGSRTGVFVGTQTSESSQLWNASEDHNTGYILTGTSMTMFANRLSYHFDLKGPSATMDTACSASLYALTQALTNIRNGVCDAAIVAGSNLNLQPAFSQQFMKLGMLSADGMCKSFDAEGNGYVRSEGMVVIYIQKKDDAKRIYCTLMNAKTNTDGYKLQGVTFPSGEFQKKLIIETYKEVNVDPVTVAYVEAHGTGTPVGDPAEANAICDVFCKGRENPLLIGSVKSNMGHCESPSGLAAIAKVIIAMEENVIPANLHYKSPNKDIPGLLNGQMQVVSKNTDWKGGIVGLNSFGFGGTNVHAMLKSHDKSRTRRSGCEKPRLFVYGSRTQEGLESMMNFVQEHPHDLDLHQLLNETAYMPLKTHPYRGFTLLNGSENVQHMKKVTPGERPVWFVFSGMGSQWAGMGKAMMDIEVFRNSIMKSDAILKPYGINLYDMLTSDENHFTNVVNSIVGITSIQVALVDLLETLGIKPDGIVGHSVGEIGCAYADGCFTAREAVLAAYWRGQCIKTAKLPIGAMAAIGLTWEEALEQCPPGVVPACHNAEDSVTISGEENLVKGFVESLQEKGEFAKMVDSSGVAFHSHYMKQAAAPLKAALEKVITPKPRTDKWISTSFPPSEWSTDAARFSSADYHVKNLISPVLFCDALKHVPSNAVVMEIAPHGLLQAILKRSLSPNCCIVGLMKKGDANNHEFILRSLGRCYQAGLKLEPLNLFPLAPFPVPHGTPMVSPHIKWDHSQEWKVARHVPLEKDVERGCTFDIDLSKDSADHFLVDHTIDGRTVFPGAGYFVLTWRAIAKREGKPIEEVPVMFEDVKIHKAAILSEKRKNPLEVHLIPGTDNFEVLDEHSELLASGKVTLPEADYLAKFLSDTDDEKNEQNGFEGGLQSEDIYKELRMMGFDFGPTFKSIKATNLELTRALTHWTGNWVTFIDALIQMKCSGMRSQRLPTGVTSLMIDPVLHQQRIINMEDGTQAVKATVNHDTETQTAGGVRVYKVQVMTTRRLDKQHPVLEAHTFVPYSLSVTTADQNELQVYADHCKQQSIKALENMNKTELTNGLRSLFSDGLVVEKYTDVTEDKLSDCIYNHTDEKLHSWLGVLKEVSDIDPDKTFAAKTSDCILAKASVLQQDMLLGNLLQRQYLNPCLDLVLENCSGRAINVLEIAIRDRTNALDTILRSHTLRRITHTIATSDLTLFENLPENEKVDNVIQWKLGENTQTPVEKAHLIFSNSILRKQPNIQTALSNIWECLEDGGFLLVHEVTRNFNLSLLQDEFHHRASTDIQFEDLTERTCSIYSDGSTWKRFFSDAGFEIVQEVSDNVHSSLFLLRKPLTSLVGSQTILNISDSTDNWLEELKTKLEDVKTKSAGENIWLTSDNVNSGILGMVNCLRQEEGGNRIRCIFNMDNDDALTDDETMKTLVRRDLVMNVFKHGQWGTYRHVPLKPVATIPSEYASVNISTRGDLSSLKWYQSPLRDIKYIKSADKSLCDIHYASLNFRDIMLATGKLSQDAIPGGQQNQDCMLGMEFSGIDESGRRVMGILPAKGLSTVVDAEKSLIIPVPDEWTLEQAATVPVVYSTAVYALVVRGNIRTGSTVLIHSGTGGVGQAAINIALHYGCTIFTTVGSEEKRQYLKEIFPQLNEHNILNSRDTLFEPKILQATSGKGVDIVLNSLAGDKLQSSVRVLAKHGRFLEIGKVDLAMNTPLGMSHFLKNITFHGILLDSLFDDDNSEFRAINQFITKGMQAGFVKPLKATVFNKNDVEEAFRYMAKGKHMGKILIKIRNDNQPVLVPAIPRTFCHPRKTYIITGGLGGFGFELAQWLVEKGARSLILTSRSGVKNGYQKLKLERLRDLGATVIVSKRDVCNKEDTLKLFEDTNGLPVGGVFHLAAVLSDKAFVNQTVESFRRVCGPKVQGTINLDQVTRKTCTNTLDWFVVFSSVTSGRGNAGQVNYGFANSAMERICEQRREDGLPGLAIQWGPIGDVGMFMDMMGDNNRALGGFFPQRMPSCMQALDLFLNQSEPVVSSYVPAEISTKGNLSGANLVENIFNIIGINNPESIDPDKSFGDLGLDSLLGVEVKMTLESAFNISLGPKEIRELTRNKLKKMAAEQSAKGKDVEKEIQVLAEKTALEPEQMFTEAMMAQPIPTEAVVKLNDSTTGTPLFIMHNITGHADAVDVIGKYTSVPVYGLQRTADINRNSIEEMAASYIQVIMNYLPNQEFHLAGYSFGAVLAQEMALQCQEKHPNTLKSLILLDGSYKWCDIMFDRVENNDDHTEAKAIRSIFRYVGLEFQGNEMIFSEKLIEEIIEMAYRQRPHLKPDEIRTACWYGYQNLTILRHYKPSKMYHGELHLLAAENSLKMLDIDPYYGLKEFCSGDIKVKVVKGRHVSFIQGEAGIHVANIINSIVSCYSQS